MTQSKLPAYKVKRIVFADYEEKYGEWENGYHVGATKGDNLRMFISESQEEIYICVQPGLKIMFSEDCTRMFQDFVRLETIDFGPKGLISTENVKKMGFMFVRCKSLKEIDLSGWDVSNVDAFTSMFNGCSALKSINMFGWNVTSNKTNFSRMFSGCESLEELDLSGWDLATTLGAGEMFNGCSALKTIYAEDWTVHGYLLTRSPNMFLGCTSLPGYDEGKVSGEYAKPITSGGYFTVK